MWKVHRLSVVALCGLVAIIDIGAWAVWARDTSKGRQDTTTASHTPWLVVEPGTEILFELSRAVEPGDWPEEPRALPGGGTILPPSPPSDGKYWARDTLLKWQAIGLVWATKTHLLYVAPNEPGMLDGLELYPGRFVDPPAEAQTPSTSPTVMQPEARLMIVIRGDRGLESHGLRPEQAAPDHWWGEGSVKFRIVSLRSRAEAAGD